VATGQARWHILFHGIYVSSLLTGISPSSEHSTHTGTVPMPWLFEVIRKKSNTSHWLLFLKCVNVVWPTSLYAVQLASNEFDAPIPRQDGLVASHIQLDLRIYLN